VVGCAEMRARSVRTIAIIGGAGLVASLAGCSSPARPSVSVASGRPVSPTNGTQFLYYSQPITLVVANGVATGGASTMTAVDVATDAAFTAVVTTQTVTPTANGQPIVTLDHLAPATRYYWRCENDGGRELCRLLGLGEFQHQPPAGDPATRPVAAAVQFIHAQAANVSRDGRDVYGPSRHAYVSLRRSDRLGVQHDRGERGAASDGGRVATRVNRFHHERPPRAVAPINWCDHVTAARGLARIVGPTRGTLQT
jgi:hypothetical protein